MAGEFRRGLSPGSIASSKSFKVGSRPSLSKKRNPARLGSARLGSQMFEEENVSPFSLLPSPSFSPISMATSAVGVAAAANNPSPSCPSLMESLFQRSLDDLIKSLRSQPSSESSIIARAIADIRREIRSPDLDTKAVALQKLTYLSSLHYLDMSLAAFPALELLPSPSLHHVRLTYLAAHLSFHPSTTDVLPLATHQIRKHLASATLPSSPATGALAAPALHLLALATSPDLSRHLAPDLLPLLSSSPNSARFRPRAAATALRVLALCPDAVPLLFKPLVDCLSSPDPRTVSAAVSAFCELTLSGADSAPFLPLAPEFYRILIESRNNWIIIKVLKIFTRLAPIEPRLATRIVDPVCELIQKSAAKSLVFECLRTVFSCLYGNQRAVRLALDKVKEFLAADEDPNLRYLGLQALSMLGPELSFAVGENKAAVIRALTDSDINIRREALLLLMRMVTENNVVEFSTLLVDYAMKSDPSFANEVLDAVLTVCNRHVYELIVDFDWYVALLGDIVRNPHFAKGEEVERQIVDIALRVRDARPELVRVARELLIDPALLGNPFLSTVLSASAWVSGEYVEFSRNLLELVEALLQPRTGLLTSSVRAVYIQSVFKVLAFYMCSFVKQMQEKEALPDGILPYADLLGDQEESHAAAIGHSNGTAVGSEDIVAASAFGNLLNFIETAVGPLSECDEVEVQERSRNLLGFIHIIRESGLLSTKKDEILTNNDKICEIVKLVQAAFSEDLGPVPLNAQRRIPVPEGLILPENLADIANFLGDEYNNTVTAISFSVRVHDPREIKEDSVKAVGSTSLLVEHRKRHELYYLSAEKVEKESNDYPRANEPILPFSHGDVTEDLENVTEQSLVPRKAKTTKARPVVIRLDEGDDVSTSTSRIPKESKNNLLSGAVREVLLRNENEESSSSRRLLAKGSRIRMDSPDNSEIDSQLDENFASIGKEHGSTSSKRSRRRSQTKEKNGGAKDYQDKGLQRTSSRSSHDHGRPRHREKDDVPADVVPQAPVIQDFLL